MSFIRIREAYDNEGFVSGYYYETGTEAETGYKSETFPNIGEAEQAAVASFGEVKWTLPSYPGEGDISPDILEYATV